MYITNDYVFFWGYADIYSNFHPSTFTEGGFSFRCSEQYFMFKKAMHFGDLETAHKVLKETKPFEMKKLGRKVVGFDKAAWDEVCVTYMQQACYLKFSQNPALARQLLDTGNRTLVEASPSDTIWGIGLGENDPRALNPECWRGQNLLGNVLMAVRERLRLEQRQQPQTTLAI